MKTIGLDVGGSRLRAALVKDGVIVARHVVALSADKSPASVVAQIADAVGAIDPSNSNVSVGIGLAAIFSNAAGHVAVSPHYGWRDIDIGTLLRARLARPLTVENDLTAITWGEFQFGAGRGARNLLCVFVGTGVGGGAVIERQIYRGSSNSAMEIGHVKINVTGPACGCGARGCLEAYVGGAYMPKSPEESTDWQALGETLGQAIGNAVTLLNPDRLVMGGSVWLGQAALRKSAVAALAETTIAPAWAALSVCNTTLGDDAGMLGAADLVRRIVAGEPSGDSPAIRR